MCYIKWYNNNRSFRGPQALACLRTTGAPVWEPLHENTTLPKFRFTLIPPNLWRRTRVFIFLVRADSGLSWVNPEISCRRPRLPGGIWWYTEPVCLSLSLRRFAFRLCAEMYRRHPAKGENNDMRFLFFSFMKYLFNFVWWSPRRIYSHIKWIDKGGETFFDSTFSFQTHIFITPPGALSSIWETLPHR